MAFSGDGLGPLVAIVQDGVCNCRRPLCIRPLCCVRTGLILYQGRGGYLRASLNIGFLNRQLLLEALVGVNDRWQAMYNDVDAGTGHRLVNVVALMVFLSLALPYPAFSSMPMRRQLCTCRRRVSSVPRDNSYPFQDPSRTQ